ncbi:helix-turn-helix domain-containing protein [Paenibacillus abyssi]|uniref:DNA-binding transcriptional regulator AraC n=1 Tax=Paenibacillus abyssi TaxID=1340531 RepID=A0A917CTB6_9BACL|nr:helix-turn-helix domain-containing protein [Paenibacillus abyssi]GGF96258.1 DNA-binding transcriptional regulator AraC [Paenibacillus abyssi]
MRVNSSTEFDGQAYGFVIAGHFNEDDTYVTKRPQGMSDWLITYTLGGEGYFITPGQETICRAGDVTLLKSGLPHQYGTRKGQTWHFVWAHFSPQLMEPSLLPDENLFLQSVTIESTRKRIYHAFRRILSDSRARGDYWHELCMNALREILMLVAQKKRQTYDDRIGETLHLLSRHMKDPLRIEQLARTIGLSPSRLSHLFKENTGQSIVDALNQMRIRQAALLLQHTERSASEVALDVGFNNYNHFINQFRKRFGVNPSTFKKKIRE